MYEGVGSVIWGGGKDHRTYAAQPPHTDAKTQNIIEER